jgi:hypothetical protein
MFLSGVAGPDLPREPPARGRRARGRRAALLLRGGLAPDLLRTILEADVNSGIEAGYWRDVIGAEFDSLPRLSVTVAQAMRLWSIDAAIARRVLDSYVESGYLMVTAGGQYQRSDYATALDRTAVAG